MTGLALRSLRHRAAASTATFAAVLLGTLLVGSFATLVETATGAVSAADRDTLITMGAVVGGWGAVIVLFSVASTTGVTVRQREAEIGLLRTVGMTPRQGRRLVVAEVALVALVAAAAGALLAAAGGRALLALLRSGDLVSADLPWGGGPASLAVTAAAVVATSVLAALLAARRAT
ncbi:FtsX-like permease family protein, partial [Kineococcus glutinatus]|uniref:FtsX-like permease family protein n=1 Tax=Kineococcus glutinatus TaxID=1070872 RepID=UPI0031E6D11D